MTLTALGLVSNSHFLGEQIKEIKDERKPTGRSLDERQDNVENKFIKIQNGITGIKAEIKSLTGHK